MARGLTKRRKRSGRAAIRQPSSTKSKRLLNPLGNNIIAQNWDKKETTTQNYRRLGLVARLKAPTGGVEPKLQQQQQPGRRKADPFAIQATGTTGVVGEARVERDECGRIVRILGVDGRDNPLNDPLNALDTDSEDEIRDDGETWGGIDKEDTTDVVRELEAEARRPREKKIRGQSQREREWLQSLVDRHGDDVKAMVRDPKLNPMQQTEGDIARRLKKFKGAAA